MTPQEIKEHFEANCLDGDTLEESAKSCFLNAQYILDYIQEYYTLKTESD